MVEVLPQLKAKKREMGLQLFSAEIAYHSTTRVDSVEKSISGRFEC